MIEGFFSVFGVFRGTRFPFQSGAIERTTEKPARMGTENTESIMSPFRYVVIKRFFSVFGVFCGSRFPFQSGVIERTTENTENTEKRFNPNYAG